MIPATHIHSDIACRYLCREHRWSGSETMPFDDGRLRCDVCGVTHYDVKPVPHWSRPRDTAS